MSIAVSAVVHPSKILLSLTLAMCAGSAAIGMWLGWEAIGAAAPAVRAALAVACVLAALIVASQILRYRYTRHIEISGNGLIQVSVVKTAPSVHHDASVRVGNPVRPQTLLPSSTLWPHLMILNLRTDDGTNTTLLILPDSMSQTSFRAFSVACHWIAAHNNRAVSDIK